MNKCLYPDLPPLCKKEVRYIQKTMSSEKGLAFDGLSDTWFRDTKNWKLLSNWWDSKTMKSISKESFEARLIPLNKVHPSLPRQGQFRPIIVLSAGFKFIEARFLK
jgi:hypothetical protein